MDTDQPIPELADRDKLLMRVLEDLPPDLVNVLINIHDQQGCPMAQFIADSIGEKLDRLSCEQRQEVIERFRNEGIDLEEATGR